MIKKEPVVLIDRDFKPNKKVVEAVSAALTETLSEVTFSLTFMTCPMRWSKKTIGLWKIFWWVASRIVKRIECNPANGRKCPENCPFRQTPNPR